MAFGWDYGVAGFPALVATLCMFSQPLVASELIRFVADKSTMTIGCTSLLLIVCQSVDLILRWLDGIGLVVLAFLLQTTAGICETNFFFSVERVGMHIANSLTCLVYRKSLRLPGVNSGNASNLLTVDPRVRFDDLL